MPPDVQNRRTATQAAQEGLLSISFTVVFARVDGAGKSETVNRLYERLGRVRTGVQRRVERTSTRQARWTLVAANDKRYARIEVLRTLCERLETVLADAPKS